MNPIEFPDSLVKCSQCGQFRSKRNMARHQKGKNCMAAVAAQISGDLAGTEQGDMTPHRSRSVSRDRSFYTPTVAYVPTEVSALRASVIREAVSALLDQHSDYMQQGLEAYLSRHYPEVPKNLRAPIVVAATAGARQATLMHVVGEKNVDSPDPGKRRFAAEAASSLSFWALGVLPVHRSGSVYRASAQTLTATLSAPAPSVDSQPEVNQSTQPVTVGEELAAIAETVVQRPVVQVSARQGPMCAPQVGQRPLCVSQLGSNPLTLQDVSFPVALRLQDGEFDALMLLHGTQLAGEDLFAAMPAAVTPIQSVAPTVNAEVGVQPPFSAQQKTASVNPSNDSELGRSPVIELHAASDVESDGGRATSTVTVSALGGTTVSAVATVREAANDSLQTKSKEHRATSSTAQPSTGGWVRDGQKCTRSRSRSPRQRQSRGQQDFVYRRAQKSYTVDADDYRRFQDFMLRRRN